MGGAIGGYLYSLSGDWVLPAAAMLMFFVALATWLIPKNINQK
jgi:hypothetical protein